MENNGTRLPGSRVLEDDDDDDDDGEGHDSFSIKSQSFDHHHKQGHHVISRNDS